MATENSSWENEKLVRDFAELGPQGGLTPDHLGIPDKTSVDNKGLFFVPVDLCDPNTAASNNSRVYLR